MPEEVKAAEAAENEEVQTPEVPDTKDPIEINGKEFIVLGTTIKKGRGKGNLRYYLIPDEVKKPDGSVVVNYDTFFARIKEAVGAENWNKVLYAELIRQACNDSTVQALNDSEDGKVSDVAFAKAFTDWWLPSTRRSGTHIKDLREKAQAIFSELNPLLIQHFQHPKEDDPERLSQEKHNRMLQLTLEYADLNTKIEEKSRKGKTKKGATTTTAAPTTPTAK